MKLNDFCALGQQEQFVVLYKHGVFVGKRTENQQVVVLYQLGAFYVEIFYKQYRKYVDHLNVFTCVDLLQPYLEEIDVEALINCTS